jgi:hypothetical protein
MKIEIKSIFGELIFEGDFASISEAVKAAIAAKKSFSYANLRYANLRSANLSYADLRSANLSYANLSYANLSSADLRSANLSYADLSSANLSSADLSYADLSSADLSSANLRSANLSYADLRYANLSYAKNSELAIATTRILPQGTIIGWKKLTNGVIAKLRIPESAKRSHAFGRKCRAEFADVLELIGADGKPFSGSAESSYEKGFGYTVGATVEPSRAFSEEWQDECASGIHFFITREEAENYTL